jgi:nicotinate-nucleotide adenylyltransferase
MNILLFGGSFNPPHLGHDIVIHQAFELIKHIEELWLLPTYNHAFGKDLAPAADRLEMCQLLIHNSKKTKICSIEIDHQTSGSTYETQKLLKREYPDHNFSFLMGSDQLPEFHKWNNHQQLLNEMPFYVYPRGSHRHDVTYPNMTLLESPTQIITNISSTLIRNRIKHNLPIGRIIPQNIAKYIIDHRLYHS